MSKNDKRPAFPSPFHNFTNGNQIAPDGQLVPPSCSIPMYGMTLRQLYAGLAMQGYLASYEPLGDPAEAATTIARDCWKLADALIATENEG